MPITPIRKQDRLESRPHADCDSVSSVRRPTDAIGDTLVTCAGDTRLIEVAASEAGPDTLGRRTASVTALPTRSAPPRGGGVEGAMQGFDDCFAALQDPRGVNARRHDLWEILMIALCAVLSGGQTAVDMAVFAEAKEDFLGNFLQLKNGVPSHDTFSRVFRQLDPDQFRVCFQRFTARFSETSTGVIAIDGKVLRRPLDPAHRGSALHMISA
jgi:hypothetical protein